MRYLVLLFLLIALPASVLAQEIALSAFSGFNKDEVLLSPDQPAVAEDLFVSATAINLSVARTSKRDKAYRYMDVTVGYDDRNRELFSIRLDSFSSDSTFVFPLAYGEGRRVQKITISSNNTAGEVAITAVRYTAGGPTVDWTSTDLRGTGFADKENALQNDILVISSPIDAPPHLTKLHKPKVTFVASLANCEGEALKGTGVLTCYLIDLSEEMVETKKFTVTATPQSFTLDLSDKDLTYGYLVTFQPVNGQPWVAIRQMQVSEE